MCTPRSPGRAFAPLSIPLAALGLFGALTGGCSTEAIAIQQCREVEFLRCEASVSCSIIDQDEVESCKRFYDHHCLHGIAGPEEPSAEEQNGCLEHIESAWEEAKNTLDDETAEEEHDAACAIIAAPWDDEACSYLKKTEGAGGASAGKEEEEEEEKQ